MTTRRLTLGVLCHQNVVEHRRRQRGRVLVEAAAERGDDDGVVAALQRSPKHRAHSGAHDSQVCIAVLAYSKR